MIAGRGILNVEVSNTSLKPCENGDITPHCKPIAAMRTGLPVMKTGFSLWEKLHREDPVLITGMGLQCTLPLQDTHISVNS